MEPEHYDLVVVGAGPAGEKAAAQAAYWGKRVAVVDRQRRPGGTMVGGAVASKTMREAALYLTGFRQRDVYDVGVDLEPGAAVERLRRRTERVVGMMTDGVAANLARHGVDVFHGSATLAPERTVVVRGDDGDPDRALRADVVMITTGSRPFHPPGVDFDGVDILDADAAALLDRPLRSLVVVGGGAVGCEFASIFTALGTEVVLADSGHRLLPFMDAEVSDVLARTFREMGMRVLQGAGRAGAVRAPGGVEVTLQSGEVLRPEKAIFATGRTGNTDGLGLAEAGWRPTTVAASSWTSGSAPPPRASLPQATYSVHRRSGRCRWSRPGWRRAGPSASPSSERSTPWHRSACTPSPRWRWSASRRRRHRPRASPTRSDARGSSRTREPPSGAPPTAWSSWCSLGTTRGSSACTSSAKGRPSWCILHFGGTIDHFIDTTFNVPTMSEAYKYAAYDGLAKIGR